MSLQFSTSYRNGMLNLFETTTTAVLGASAVLKIWTGSPPANCGTADSGTNLVTYSLASSWIAAASGGAATLNSLPIAGTASNTGTAGYFRLYDSTATTCHMQGTVTATGGGGDATIDNTSITSAQTVNLTGFTLTAPGA